MARDINKMRHLFTIMAQQLGNPDTFGQPSEVWTSIGTRFGAFDLHALNTATQSAEYRRPSGALEGASPHVIRIRYFPGLALEHRLALGSRLFHIHRINDVENFHDEMELLAFEPTKAG